jgi:hypothetical protein
MDYIQATHGIVSSSLAGASSYMPHSLAPAGDIYDAMAAAT